MWTKPKARNSFWRRNQSGTAAIEFAMLAPVLALVFVGMVDLGSLFYQAMQLNGAVEAGTLYVIKNGWSSSTGAAPIITAMQSTGAVTGTPTASCFYGCPTSTGIATEPGVCGSGSSVTTCTLTQEPPGQYVAISAQLSTTTLVATGIFGFFGGSLALPNPLTATITVRWQ